MSSTQKKHYIFGYGSLINSRSRAFTGETGQVWPVRLSGYQRHWCVISDQLGMSSVAVIKAPGQHCNGVLVEVPANQLPAFDEREAGYTRAEVKHEHLQPYHHTALPTGHVWIYHTETITPPTEQCPIALSYADVILAGCLEHGEQFLQDFLAHTQGWHHPLTNDRPTPRYPRVQPELHAHTTLFNAVLAEVSPHPEALLKDSYVHPKTCTQ